MRGRATWSGFGVWTSPWSASLYLFWKLFFSFSGILSGTGCISHTHTRASLPKRKSFSSIYEIINLCTWAMMYARALNATTDSTSWVWVGKTHKRSNQNRCDATCPGWKRGPEKYLLSFATKRPVIWFEWHTNRLHLFIAITQNDKILVEANAWILRHPAHIENGRTRSNVISSEYNVVSSNRLSSRVVAIQASFVHPSSVLGFGFVWPVVALDTFYALQRFV